MEKGTMKIEVGKNFIKAFIGSLIISIALFIASDRLDLAFVVFISCFIVFFMASIFVDLISRLLDIRKEVKDRKINKEERTKK